MVDFSPTSRVPTEENAMLDLSEVSELGNSLRSSGCGSWGWNDEPSSGNSAEESLKSAKIRVDEAFLEYTIIEKAALMLQKSFRSKRNGRNKHLEDMPLQDATDTTHDDSSDDPKKESEDGESADKSNWYTILFLGTFGFFQLLLTFIKACCEGSSNVMEVDAVSVDGVVPVDGAVNAATPNRGGGGIPPLGLEAMAGQAAETVSSSVGTGMSAGAAAGAAASKTATAAGVTTQVVTIVAVSSAVATVATTSGILTPASPAEVILSTCGLVNPKKRIGKFTAVFEGFGGPLDGRESNILESLVLQAYNDVTFGADFNVTQNCLDPLSREMEDVNILKQTILPLIEGGLDGSSYLEIKFETRTVCDLCLASRPLFKTEREQGLVENVGEKNGAQMEDSPRDSTGSFEDVGEQHQNGDRFQDGLQNAAEKELTVFDDHSGADFFHEVIQRITFETEELSLIGELPAGFARVAQAYVTPTPGDNGVDVDETDGGGASSGAIGDDGEGLSQDDVDLLTHIKFQRQANMAVFEFTFVDQDTQETMQETVVVNPSDPNSIPVPTTSLPTFAPSREPTTSPSTHPTINFSGQPTRIPSKSPSL
ncbi:MAG: hypothetical protein SGBAC_009419 [Bacillariaceae sp.]